jgi:hypothetical protein
VQALEEKASRQSGVESDVRRHIASSVRSLLMLAKGVGIENGEFAEMVKDEIEGLKGGD